MSSSPGRTEPPRPAAESRLARLGDLLQRIAARTVPDPFILALGLTVLVFALAALRTGAAPEADGRGIFWPLMLGWFEGFSGAGGLAFALQMSLILVTGHALALSPPVQALIARVARLPRGPASASTLVALFSCLAATLHWGLGAIAGALLAREVARHGLRNGTPMHYPLLGAAAYAGFAVWHGGLSGSAPLKAAEAGNFAEPLVGLIPLSQTLFSSLNVVITGSLLVTIPFLFYLLTPRSAAACILPDAGRLGKETPAMPPAAQDSLIARLQTNPWGGRAVGALGLTVLLAAVFTGRLALDLPSVILFFLFLGILLVGSLGRYVDRIAEGAGGAGAIILQFPFYFGILGVMRAGGLIEWISEGLIAISTADTFPVLAFWSAGLVNLFVPSGGGQWAVQANILLGAGKSLGVEPASVVMAFSYGDAWTNLLQPFWALPLLGIMGLQARDIIAYTAIVCVLMGIQVSGLLYLMG